ncbi:DUF3397 family protein [Planococcus salinus]|uniref:DUF3397 family protein n=1 Tax=Planococcus salinus TaxID=1848460 RepID=A0A3M8PBW6_9BACL|nr:DUF3397 family protein [Planococcus salinus]RNF40684.1 DUF3397 family protein [Planococcus salinus]
MIIIHSIGTIFIFWPFLAFLLVWLSSRKRMGWKAVGISADVTTFLLFFSVPMSIQTLWGYAASGIIYFIAIIIGIVYLIIEWKRSKEIIIMQYLRKLWRTYFLILSLAYAAVWLIGMVMKVQEYFR